MAEKKENKKEVYRVFVTGIPTNTNTEKFVKDKCKKELPGDVVSVNTQGCNTCAVVTMECDKGKYEYFQEKKVGSMVIKNWGIFNATLSLENVPMEVQEKLFKLAPEHGVFRSHTKLRLHGSIDSLYNLSADVDSSFIMKEQENKLESAKPKPMERLSNPGMPAHIAMPKPNVSIPGPSPTSMSPLRPPVLVLNSTSSVPSSVPGSAIAIPSKHDASGPIVEDNPTGSGAKVRESLESDRSTSPSTPVESTPPSSHSATSSKAKANVIGDLYSDALALVQRLPEGNIPGVEYHVQEGAIHVTVEGKKKINETVSKFQDVYKKMFAPGQQLRVENIQIPHGCSKSDVKKEIATFEQRYLSTAFVLDEEKRVVRVISQSRQLDQAKKFLEEALQQLVHPSSVASALCAPKIIKLSENRTLTLKKGDLVQEKADILVNAANGRLDHAGGVARALNIASNRELQRNSDIFMQKMTRGKEVATGSVVWTRGGGNLACKHVIHAVGPEGSKHSPQQSEHLLKQVVHSTLKTAEKLDACSIVFPAISCGVFKVNRDLVARCIIDAIMGYSYTKPAPSLSDIRIVIIDEPSHTSFARYFEQIGGGPSARSSVGAASHMDCSKLLEVRLTSADLDWIMPLLRHVAPKWKSILHIFGVPNEIITDMMKQNDDEVVLLNMGMMRLVVSPGISLANLINVLQRPEIGAGNTATNILKDAMERSRRVDEKSNTLIDVTYPNLDTSKPTETSNDCPICLEQFISPVETICNHVFCNECLRECLKHSPYCPTCKTPLRTITGNQPPGSMKHTILNLSVPGYEGYDTIKIEYRFPDGTQGPEHPNPGKHYYGTHRIAYLPHTHEGWDVFLLLQKAFQARMIFTIGTSVSTGAQNTVVWNDIHHKTSINKGNYCYPDPTYLQRVKEDLAAKGIIPDPVS